MNRKVMRSFVAQFSKEWECSCSEPFKVENLEIVSETDHSLIAHYICPKCKVEQMLAASISEEKDMLEQNFQTLNFNSLTSDDVLDIREDLQTTRLGSIKALYRNKVKKAVPATASGSTRAS